MAVNDNTVGRFSGGLLVVDDDALVRKSIRQTLARLTVDVRECGDGRSAIATAVEIEPAAILLDLDLPDVSGIDVLCAVKAERPDVPVIVVSGSGSVETAVEAMHRGAEDFLTKPFEPARLLAAVRNALRLSALGRRVGELEGVLDASAPFASMIGCSSTMRRLFTNLRKLTHSSATVLVQGETGVGKDLVARALHTEGQRSHGPFVEVNCAAIPSDLLENELFGHESEAFTGASHRRLGKIEAANGGTFFLDEIGDLALSSQAKLLRVLQNRQVERLGSNAAVPIDVRVVAATNRQLSEEVAAGRFRADLYYRISVYPLYVPPLRERREDIPPLVEQFVHRAAEAERKACSGVSKDAMAILVAYEWPGNVRELENVIRRAMISLEGDVVRASDLPPHLSATNDAPPPRREPVGAGNELLPLHEVEREYVALVLRRCSGNLSEAARALGIGRTTLYRKIEKYGLLVGESRP
jgi:DNA-binding NtrC family response regulator